MRAEVLSIGFCLPERRDGTRDWGWLSGALAELGAQLAAVSLVRVREGEAEAALNDALGRSQLVIVTSPVASGTDELAKKAIARALGKRLVLQPDLLGRLEGSYAARGAVPPAGFEKLALLPTGSKVFFAGDYAGFSAVKAGKLIIYAPGMDAGGAEGVVKELEGLLRGRGGRKFEKTRILWCYGIDEARSRELLEGLGQAGQLAFSASIEGIDIKVSVSADSAAKAEGALGELAGAAIRRLGDYFYGTDSEKMEEAVARLLVHRKMTVATAESCTGGLLSKRLTDISGSSAYMERGVVTYSNRSKEELLGVPAKTLAEHGAVSKETAEAMAVGIRKNAKADFGISITGIAGPTGGTPTKPVGLVYIGLATPDGVTVKGYTFPGGREQVRFAASQRALDLLRRYLLTA